MHRKFKPLLFSFLVLILFLFTFYNILSYFNFFKKNLTIVNKTLYSNLLPEDNFKSTYTPKLKFVDRPISKINGISFNILKENNISNVPVILKSQRYYIPLSFICTKLNYTLNKTNGSFSINNTDNTITLTENSYERNSKKESLRGNVLNYNGTDYVSISDIEELFGLIAVFDFQNKKITLLNNDIKTPEEPSVIYSDKIALIRFEDFGCGYSNLEDKNQAKVKLMSNLLYSNGIKFHIAWIPRFIVPDANFDNDLLTNDNIVNVGFVNLLDYMVNKGGEIGLHGYTHQSGKESSAVGEEMSKNTNSTVSETRAVIEKGIDTASALNIPISFYESPHYRDTEMQKKIISEYFQFVFEPYDNSKKNIYRPNDYNLFVPTPLGYVSDIVPDTDSIIDKLKKNDPDILSSFFYHPSIEIDYIKFNTDGNKLNVTYDENSPLQRITKALKEDEYTTIHIDDLLDK
ncbi:DUF2334 domain-containing protein [Clostridium saccharoperbutylacetonicum]|uniref:DUF2334 domain-containing protein n=1 Tax=Clostridium saccharoperbutylacetonicum TaxID=36745 RepID=UPI0009838DE3|nr:DUF2334 domain-containing protein [Clostridium saccharoperbutylacetonicum]AQR93790.1 hypothetical protein CLSAP_10970 [Clostridium saccharoperbutylacetonicum]NSB29490.1 hypothetical protein [Clostridium saccharoperbutylacetonicum]